MKKSIICLLVLLSLCLCLVLVACTPDDPGTGDGGNTDVVPPAPDGGDTGKKGEVETKVDMGGDVTIDAPNQQQPDSTPRY